MKRSKNAEFERLLRAQHKKTVSEAIRKLKNLDLAKRRELITKCHNYYVETIQPILKVDFGQILFLAGVYDGVVQGKKNSNLEYTLELSLSEDIYKLFVFIDEIKEHMKNLAQKARVSPPYLRPCKKSNIRMELSKDLKGRHMKDRDRRLKTLRLKPKTKANTELETDS